MQEIRVQSRGWEDPRRRKWQPTPVILLENPMDRGAWQATVHRVTKSQRWLSDSACVLACVHVHTHTHTHTSNMCRWLPMWSILICKHCWVPAQGHNVPKLTHKSLKWKLSRYVRIWWGRLNTPRGNIRLTGLKLKINWTIRRALVLPWWDSCLISKPVQGPGRETLFSLRQVCVNLETLSRFGRWWNWKNSSPPTSGKVLTCPPCQMSGMSVTLEDRTQIFQRSQVAYPTSLLQENNPFSSDKTGFRSITFFAPLVSPGSLWAACWLPWWWERRYESSWLRVWLA